MPVSKNKPTAAAVLPLRDHSDSSVSLQELQKVLNLLQQSEERYRTFVAHSSEGIWRFELEKPVAVSSPVKKQIDHFYTYAYLAECNDSVAKMYGYKKAEDITGMRLGEFLIRDDKQNIAYLTAFIQSGYKLSDIESYERDKQGRDKYFLNSLTGIIKDKLLLRAWGTQRDITKQKKTEHSLSRLAAIVESSEDAILSRSLDGTITSWNKGAEQMYGYKAKEILGKNVRLLIPTGKDYEARDIEARIIRGEHIHHFEQIRWRKDGSEIPISLSVSPIKNDSGEVIGISTIARDITDRVKLQQQKDEFIGIASHELKTPVTSIKAYTQVIQNRFAKKGDEASVLMLSKMDSQLNKLTDLISDLLDVTKIESGKLVLELAYFDYNELVEEIVEEMQRTTRDHTIVVKLEKTKTVYGDRNRIGQVMMNLMSNAIKYSPESDKIIVRSDIKKSDITLCVQDFGVGIPKEKQDQVFKRFFRVSGPHQNTFPGMGLGLYISSEIVKRLGGRIWVESHKGKGSTFCFSIPMKKRKIAKKKTAPNTVKKSKAPR
jgi:PAS domain S-box-containing protein